MNIRTIAVPLLSTAALLTALTGCTNDTTTATPSTSASKPAPTPTGVAAEDQLTIPTDQAHTDCKNGIATISDNTKNIPTKIDCTKVIVTGNDSIIHLGTIDTLEVTGNLNRIELDSVKTITITNTAQTNDIIYSGTTPTITDHGTNTQIATK